MANSKLHDILILVTGADALGIVEGVLNQYVEAWCLFKSNSAMPAVVAKFEKDLQVFFDRTGETVPGGPQAPHLTADGACGVEEGD